MPFGYYEAEITAQAPKKQPKPKKQPVQPPRITNLPKPPAPQVEKPVKIPAPPPVVPAVIGNVMEITVAVAGRSVNAVTDFITGLSGTANPLLESRGMSLFCNDTEMTGELILREKKLRQVLVGGASYESTMGADAQSKNVSLLLSRSGMQSFSVRMNFVCVTTAQAASALPPCQAVWVLTDEPVYSGAQDGYSAAVAAVLNAAKGAGLIAYVVMTQLESFGKIRNDNGLCGMENTAYREASKKARAAVGDAAKGVPFVPVQVYGGQLPQASPAGSPVRRMAANYKPEGCHIPMMMTVEGINTGTRFADNELIRDVKAINRAQGAFFRQYGIEIGG